jgi:hypothetical protein
VSLNLLVHHFFVSALGWGNPGFFLGIDQSGLLRYQQAPTTKKSAQLCDVLAARLVGKGIFCITSRIAGNANGISLIVFSPH